LRVSATAEHDSVSQSGLASAVIDQSTDFIGIATPEGFTVRINRAGRAMLGLPNDLDVRQRRIADFFAPVDGQLLQNRIWPMLSADGRWTGELRVQRSDNAKLVPVEANLFAVKDGAGDLIAFAAIMRDVSARHAAEEHQRWLLREAHHRAKNTLASVIAIISTSSRAGQDPVQQQKTIIDRILALGKANTLLNESHSPRILVRDLLAKELDPVDGERPGRIFLEGPAVELPAGVAAPLGMALHELTTNALKHGALSRPLGKVKVRWQIATGRLGALSIAWVESDGPPVRTPTRLGFGSQLLSRLISQQMNGRISIDYEQTGLRATIEVPLAIPRPLPRTIGSEPSR
jgi:PAS domain S-box-containing protein